MEFSTEMVVKATLHKIRIAEIPTTLSPDGRDRAPHLRTWRDGWRYLRFMLLYSPRWLFFYPGVLVFLMGLALSLWLLAQPSHGARRNARLSHHAFWRDGDHGWIRVDELRRVQQDVRDYGRPVAG